MAHPIDAWQDGDNVKAGISLHSTPTLDERCSVAGTCLTKLGIKFPAVIDDLANSAERAYTAWPDRLYVIDREGRVPTSPSQAPSVLSRRKLPAHWGVYFRTPRLRRLRISVRSPKHLPSSHYRDNAAVPVGILQRRKSPDSSHSEASSV